MALVNIVQANKDSIAIGEAGGSVDDICSVVCLRRIRHLRRLRQVSVMG